MTRDPGVAMAEAGRRRRLGSGRWRQVVKRRVRRWIHRERVAVTSRGRGVAVGTGDAEWLHESSFPAALSEIPTARRRVAMQAEACGLSGPALFDLLLAVGEALANAVKHGSPRGVADCVGVRVGLQDGGVVVEVQDQGFGFGVTRLSPPEAFESGGRGIPFMRALVDELRFDCGTSGTVVLLLKRVG